MVKIRKGKEKIERTSGKLRTKKVKYDKALALYITDMFLN